MRFLNIKTGSDDLFSACIISRKIGEGSRVFKRETHSEVVVVVFFVCSIVYSFFEGVFSLSLSFLFGHVF